MYFLMQFIKKSLASFLIPAKKEWPESGHKKSLNGPKMKNMLQNERPVPSVEDEKG